MSNVVGVGARARALVMGALVVSAAAASSCKGATNDAPTPPPQTGLDSTGRSTLPTEWVGYHTEIPFADGDVHALISGLVGADAQARKPITEREVDKGIFLESDLDPSTPDQVRLTLSVDDGGTFRRKLAVAPASFAIGAVFATTVDAALAKMKADNVAKAGSGEAFLLEYRVASSQGGRLSIGVRGDRGVYTLVLDVGTPRTSLSRDFIGKPVEKTDPFDTVAGTVWFHMSKDDFDYFVDHAYGKGATGRQNFHDFALVPHEWLRLTVDPHLDQEFVNVGFEVIGLDGKRIAFAKAPASVLAGSAFHSMVDRAMTTSLLQEKAKVGSATPWQVPFYYDAPVDGGVVQVIAQGTAGVFSVAYAVESPRHKLKDVPFNEYEPVDIPPVDPNAKASCEKLGDPKIVLANKGTFNITFTASDVVKKSPDLKGPLKGTIACSVYHASDVSVSGPKADAIPLQDFSLPGADLGATPAPSFVTNELYDGDYQILCAQLIDGGTTAAPGDPVTLPIGSFPIACNINPVTVEFGILYPKP